MFTEDDIEEATIAWFTDLGYSYLPAEDIAPEGRYSQRQNYTEVLLAERLQNALRELNPHLPQETLDEAYHKIAMSQHPALIDNNQAFHKMMTNGVDVSVRQSDASFKTEKVQIFDWSQPKNNDLLITSQFTVVENNIEKRPDVVVFVNGIPLVVIELKNATNENTGISDAYNQIKTYQQAIPSLFVYNAFSIISDGINARIGTLTADEDRFMMWRTIDGNELVSQATAQLEVMIIGVFNPSTFLSLIYNFILYQVDGDHIRKILAIYHQYHAVLKAVDSTIQATGVSGNKKAGVVWHTQGSGKSLSMVFYVGMLVRSQQMYNPTIVVITDRNDLDDQLYGTFSKSKDLLRQTPVQAKDREDLRKLLNNREAGGIIFTTIHKFTSDVDNKIHDSNTIAVLTNRSNVVVIADEAHRSQYGFALKINECKDSQGQAGVDIKYGYARYMRESLPNASYIGFTGTPIEITDKNTRAVFGDYIDIYDMTRAVADETTVKIYYESRLIKLELPETEKNLLDQEYEDITEFQEESQKEQLKSKWSRLEAIMGAESRVNAVAKDIVEHFDRHQAAQENTEGKAMIVAMSRRIAVALYNAIILIRPQWHHNDVTKGVIKVVMTGSSADPASWQQFIGTKSSRDTLAKRMKDPLDALKIVIVRDMWLTGFDVPCMNTMYIDKPMSGHNLMQAIARVNRVFKEKQGGLIVDYIGIADHLRTALGNYTKQDREMVGVDTSLAVKLMHEKIDLIHELLHQHDYSDFFSNEANSQWRLQIIVATIDYIFGLGNNRKKDFLQLVSDLSKAYSLCSTLQEAEILNLEIGFYKAVKSGIVKLIPEQGIKKTINQLDASLSQLVSKSIASQDVIDILNDIGLNKPNIAILSDEFLEEIKGLKQQNIAVELLNKLLTGKVKTLSQQNIMQSKKFSDKLNETLRRYQNRAIETTKVILELIELAKQINEAHKRGENLGLSEEELAFYDALSAIKSSYEGMQDDTLKMIARDLTKTIRANKTVDWQVRESIQAKMRMEIRRLLRDYDYPQNKRDDAVELVMKQANIQG